MPGEPKSALENQTRARPTDGEGTVPGTRVPTRTSGRSQAVAEKAAVAETAAVEEMAAVAETAAAAETAGVEEAATVV